MKTHRFVLPVLASLWAASAWAQSSVTIYGVADAFVEFGKGTASTTKLQSGGISGSRIGFRGTEDLGGGLQAQFVIESGLAIDAGSVTQGGVFWGRQAFVGMTSPYGTFTVGRQYIPHFLSADFGDSFGTGLGSPISSGVISLPGGSRANNSGVYTTPDLGGFTAKVMAAAGEGSTGRLLSADLRYGIGPFKASLGWVRKDSFGTAVEAATGTVLSATYDFGFMKLLGGVQSVKNLTQAANTQDDRSEQYVGATAPIGAGVATVGWGTGKTKNVTGTKASEISVGYDHFLSKRTDLYVIASVINNGTATAFTANGATSTGPTTAAGTDVRSVALGVRHRF